MKKINIKPYSVERTVLDKEGKNLVKKMVPYIVVTSIENVVLASGPRTNQQLTMPEILRRAVIIEKIKAQEKKGFALLENADFDAIKAGFKAFKGFGIDEVELCKRIDQAEDVKVKEVKKKKGK